MLVDGTYDGGKFAPRSKEELDRLGALVKGTVGFDLARGDVLQIESAQFATVDAGSSGGASKDAPKPTRPPWVYAAAGAGAIVLLALIVLVVKRAKKKPVEATEAAAALAPGAEVAQLDAPAPPALPARARSADAEAVREKAMELALQDPATAAVILREWLNAPSAAAPPPAPSF